MITDRYGNNLPLPGRHAHPVWTYEQWNDLHFYDQTLCGVDLLTMAEHAPGVDKCGRGLALSRLMRRLYGQ